MLGGYDYLSGFTAAPKTKILSAFINEKTKQIDTKSLIKFAQTSKANLIMVGGVLGRFLLIDSASHPDPLSQARENISNFIKHPEYRIPKWLLSDRIGKGYAYKEVIAGRFSDSVSKILRGEITPEQQTILNSIAAILANPASVFVGIQRQTLESRSIQAYIASGQLTLEQSLIMSVDAHLAFKQEGIRAYIANGQLTIEQVLRISFDTIMAFRSEHIRAYIASGQLSIEQVLAIKPSAAIFALKEEHVRGYIASGLLTIEQVLSISYYALSAFENRLVRGYVTSGLLTIEQVLSISRQASSALENDLVRRYIVSSQLRFEQVLGISRNAVEAFDNTQVRLYLSLGELTPEQVLNGITAPAPRLLGSAPAEILSGEASSGAADYHSLSTPLLATGSNKRMRLEAPTEPDHIVSGSASAEIIGQRW